MQSKSLQKYIEINKERRIIIKTLMWAFILHPSILLLSLPIIVMFFYSLLPLIVFLSMEHVAIYIGRKLKEYALISMNLHISSFIHRHDFQNSCISMCNVCPYACMGMTFQVHIWNKLLIFLLWILMFFHGTSYNFLTTK